MYVFIPTKDWFQANGLLEDDGFPEGWAGSMVSLYGKFAEICNQEDRCVIVRDPTWGVSWRWTLLDGQYIRDMNMPPEMPPESLDIFDANWIN